MLSPRDIIVLTCCSPHHTWSNFTSSPCGQFVFLYFKMPWLIFFLKSVFVNVSVFSTDAIETDCFCLLGSTWNIWDACVLRILWMAFFAKQLDKCLMGTKRFNLLFRCIKICLTKWAGNLLALNGFLGDTGHAYFNSVYVFLPPFILFITVENWF